VQGDGDAGLGEFLVEVDGADGNGTCTYTLSGEEVMQVGPSHFVRELAAALRRERTPMRT